MRIRAGLLALFLSPLIGGALTHAQPATSPAATTQPTTETDRRLDQFEQRLNDMERRHQEELRARDAEIARLRAQLQQQQTGAPAPSPTTAPGTAPAEQSLINEIENAGRPGAAEAVPPRPAPGQTTQEMVRDAQSRSSPLSLSRTPVSFNPDLAVVSDFLGPFSTNRANNALNRVDVREVELDLRAAVDPRADGVAILSVHRDVYNPAFPGPNTYDEQSGPDTGIDIEEGYLFLHDFGVPNLTAKLGRFHLRFGRQNILHLHDLPTTDPPLVNQAFLAPEALTDAGLSLSYVIPPKLIGDNYVEIDEEILAGEGAGAESPTLRGDLSVDSPAFNTHVLWNRDLARDWNLELGASWLTGHSNSDNSHRVNIYGTDFTLIHTDPTGRFNNQLFQAEAMYGDLRDPESVKRNGWGAYVLAQQQIDRDYYVGVRLDYTQDPNSDHRELWAVSPYVSWYWSEFLRFRLEYQHKEGDVPSEDNVYLQCTWIFGAHPPHPYWAMR